MALDVVGLFNANNIKMQRKYAVVKHRPISKIIGTVKVYVFGFLCGPGFPSVVSA